MARKAETVFRARIRPLLHALPNTVVFPIQQKTIKGDPDYLLCIRGKFVALELKSEGGKLDKLQQYRLDQVRLADGYAFAVWPDDWEDVYEELKELAGG
jgi:predicted type IV restriction endonuclease